ncbi:MAG TPA: dihydrofolate reductase [Porphyromonadaceae bacterium]|nr:dihydrofolate reductase [Porphyromonadaceae bacterium]
MKWKVATASLFISLTACTSGGQKGEKKMEDNFQYSVEKFADYEVLRYKVKGFEELSLKQKKLIYYLSEATLWGRDITYDQNFCANLSIRRLLEDIYTHFDEDREGEDFRAFETYLKQLWMGNSLHHHWSTDKFTPHFSKEFMEKEMGKIDLKKFDISQEEVIKILFDSSYYPKRVNLQCNEDLLLTSAMNFYKGVTQKEGEAFYKKMKEEVGECAPQIGLNSQLVKENGMLEERVWKVGGMYSQAIEKIIFWLEKAKEVAENEMQKKVIESLILYYKSGDLGEFDRYSVLWLNDTLSCVDFVNGFIEVYGDPIGIKGTWEGIVNFKDQEATHRTEVISENAQWFEDNSPMDSRFKKEEVRGVSAKVITMAMLGGDCYPNTPIGINLPNSSWIRKEHGSKSVTISNIMDAYSKASLKNGFDEEFMISQKEIEMHEQYGGIVTPLSVDLHECLGHGSGKLLPEVSADSLRSYHSAIEEARADIFSLYYIADPKMVELGLLPNEEAYQTEYYEYMMNGLMTQLVRIELGKDIEESHMRNRAIIARWIMEKSKENKAVEWVEKNGKHFIKVNDYPTIFLIIG